MTAKIIDGKAIAATVRAEVAERVGALSERGVVPGFVDVLVGEDPASKMYVGMKYRAAGEAGMKALDQFLPANASREDLELMSKDQQLGFALQVAAI